MANVCTFFVAYHQKISFFSHGCLNFPIFFSIFQNHTPMWCTSPKLVTRATFILKHINVYFYVINNTENMELKLKFRNDV